MTSATLDPQPLQLGLLMSRGMHQAPPLALMDYVGPAVAAVAFVCIMSLVREPTRRTLNALIVAGSSGVYLNGGFGIWELVFPLIAMPVAYRGLSSHRSIGAAWLLHAARDLPHHFWGNPILPFVPTASFGCFVFDTLIAVWFLAGAPALVGPFRARAEALRPASS
jgi:hypothetical protein